MYILGISCFYHDAAACLLKDGRIVSAALEERFSRKKHDPDFPKDAINYCLSNEGIKINNVDYICFYEKPLLKFERILLTAIATFPKSLKSFTKAIPVWLKQKLYIPSIIRNRLNYEGKIVFCEHHLSHAASAFLVSPFEESAILTIDGVGEWATAAYGVGKENSITILAEMKFPHSLGLLYSAFTYYLGFKVNNGEYKVMGLAPYGKPRYYDTIMNELVDLKKDGSFRLNMKYFAYHYGLTMINHHFENLFGGPRRIPESQIEERHKDVASSIQKATEEIILKMADYLHKETRLKNLCMAGGVALNCVADGRLLQESSFENIFVQPASSDAGGALGAALYLYCSILGKKRVQRMENVYTGPSYSNEEIESFLKGNGIRYKYYARESLLRTVAGWLVNGKIIGWFQGRMEWGPRALGNRSILADPRTLKMKDIINKKVKHRESFRPFAPSVLVEKAADYFEPDCSSPYMLFTFQVKDEKQKEIPAVTHIDGTSRIQTVKREDNPLYYDLINEFNKLTGTSILLNTSFNVRGMPIVCSPMDAYKCFVKSGIDYLVMGNLVIDRKDLL